MIDPVLLKEANDALSNARIRMFADVKNVFINNICVFTDIKFKECGTAMTDGTEIILDPTFFTNKCTPKQRCFVLRHEAWHIALKHPLRMQDVKYPGIYNIAADIWINNQCKQMGDAVHPAAILEYNGDTFPEMSVDEIYEKLLKDMPEDEQQAAGEEYEESESSSDAEGKTRPDSFIGDAVAAPKEGMADIESQIDAILHSAYQAVKAAGRVGEVPSEFKHHFDNFYNPILPIKQLLNRYVTKVINTDHSWTRPHRRYMPDLYMPISKSKIAGDIAFYLDVSGSVTVEEIHCFLDEIHYVLKQNRVTDITVTLFNHGIVSSSKVKSALEMKKLNFHAGGGTVIEPVLNHMNELKPVLAFVFSDGEFPFPMDAEKQKQNVVWCISNNKMFEPANPKHKVIHYDAKKKHANRAG